MSNRYEIRFHQCDPIGGKIFAKPEEVMEISRLNFTESIEAVEKAMGGYACEVRVVEINNSGGEDVFIKYNRHSGVLEILGIEIPPETDLKRRMKETGKTGLALLAELARERNSAKMEV